MGLFIAINMDRDPILIVGAPRSGTSLTAGAIAACGAWVGPEFSKPNSQNPKGFFEGYIHSPIVGYLLSTNKSFWKAKRNASSEHDAKNLKYWTRQWDIFSEAMPDGPWLVKNPHILFRPTLGALWPLWAKEFPTAKWVIVRRNLTDIFQSHSCYPDQEFWNDWANNILGEIEPLKNSGVEYREIWPFHSLDSDLTAYKDLIAWLGLKWNDKAVREFIDPSLCHYDSEGVLHRECAPA